MTKSMKNFTIFAIIIVMLFVFTGCSITFNYGKESKETKEPKETTIEESIESPTESDIPDTKEFEYMEWPTFGAATKVPTPDWSDRGTILIDSETDFWAEIGYSTLEDYTNYVKLCQDAGYIIDYYNVANYMYYGADDNGYAVQLVFNQYDNYVSIQVTADATSWNRYWEDEEE